MLFFLHNKHPKIDVTCNCFWLHSASSKEKNVLPKLPHLTCSRHESCQLSATYPKNRPCCLYIHKIICQLSTSEPTTTIVWNFLVPCKKIQLLAAVLRECYMVCSVTLPHDSCQRLNRLFTNKKHLLQACWLPSCKMLNGLAELVSTTTWSAFMLVRICSTRHTVHFHPKL